MTNTEYDNPFFRPAPIYQDDGLVGQAVEGIWPPGDEHVLIHKLYKYFESREPNTEDGFYEIPAEFLRHGTASGDPAIARNIVSISRAVDSRVEDLGFFAKPITDKTLRGRNTGIVSGRWMSQRYFFIEDDRGFQVFAHEEQLELTPGFRASQVINNTRVSYFLSPPKT